MARASEFQFVVTDVEELLSYLTAAFEGMTGRSLNPADPENLFIKFIADIILQERVLINYAGNQNIPSRAEGENLDALGELFYVTERPGATAAECTERFYISNPQATAILIPKGTRVSDSGGALVWETTDEAFIPIGAGYVDARLRCQTAGTDGNGYMPGQISKLVDLFDYYSRCENITMSDGGSNIATDDEYYEIMRSSMDGYSCAGAKGSYVYFARQASTEIGDVVANSHAPGYVDIYVLMKDGTIASEEVKNQVFNACNPDTVRAFTDCVAVHDPEIVPYNIKLTYYVPDNLMRSPADIQEDARAVVQQYISWQSGKLGRDINPSYLIGLLMNTGIKRVELELPVFTKLRDGSDGSAPQIAELGDIEIIAGGIENE